MTRGGESAPRGARRASTVCQAGHSQHLVMHLESSGPSDGMLCSSSFRPGRNAVRIPVVSRRGSDSYSNRLPASETFVSSALRYCLQSSGARYRERVPLELLVGNADVMEGRELDLALTCKNCPKGWSARLNSLAGACVVPLRLDLCKSCAPTDVMVRSGSEQSDAFPFRWTDAIFGASSILGE